VVHVGLDRPVDQETATHNKRESRKRGREREQNVQKHAKAVGQSASRMTMHGVTDYQNAERRKSTVYGTVGIKLKDNCCLYNHLRVDCI